MNPQVIEAMAKAMHAVCVRRVGPEGETWDTAQPLTKDIALEMTAAAAAAIPAGEEEKPA